MNNLWTETPGENFVDKYAVLLLDVKSQHMNRIGGTPAQSWVTFNDAVVLAKQLSDAQREFYEQEFDDWLDQAFPEEAPGTHVEQQCFTVPGVHTVDCPSFSNPLED